MLKQKNRMPTINQTGYTNHVHALSIVKATAVQMLNQGTIRQRGVSVGGVFFCLSRFNGSYFLDKQKVIKKNSCLQLFSIC
ncbi:hypothetical protein [Lacibacter sp. H407]|uniref:hypothetical protein n=1 Tax=Lacibacter sp. H407 TaxID=3133423 RepID=UPI0030C42BDB